MEGPLPVGFYVYLHLRRSDGLVFYVGKGSGARAWSIRDEIRNNIRWSRTKRKHGITVAIYRSSMTECCAFTLEKILISRYRSLGHPICNMTDGGEGVIGHGEYRIFSSDGMQFRSARVASDWLKINGYPKANAPYLSAAASGRRKTAYGRVWSYEGRPELKEPEMKIFSSMGEGFSSLSSAISYLKKNGYPKASCSAVAACLKGKSYTAYGRAWANGYIPDAPEQIGMKNAGLINSRLLAKPVVNSDGDRFASMKIAAEKMKELGHQRANATCIRNCINGITDQAYGYKWREE